LLLLVIFFFELPGLLIGLGLIFLYLARLKSFGQPYLYPLLPFKGKELLKYLVRVPYRQNKQ
ncbi:MAG: spore germination protein, partial [Acholeplasmataceae bacterium]|nr:spore germination protein [Acholeplasmataceae bacterium]